MRPRTFAEKALARAAGRDDVCAGDIVDARPAIALSHDNSAAIADIFAELGAPRVAIPDRIAITLDHAAPAPTARHADNHVRIRRFVRAHGIRHFFEVGRGICHQVLGEEGLVAPGDLVLGADSHTPHFGWLGAFGAGVGRSEMAVVWATGELWLRVPESIAIRIEGRLGPWVTAKDLALTVIGTLGADGGRYRSIEFSGDGVAALSLSSRATLANMMAEFGAKAAFVPPDDAVFRAVALARGGGEAERRRLVSCAIVPDPGACYEAEHVFDASAIEPRVSCPHRVDETAPASALADVVVDQAFVGTCTNGRLEDIEAVHRVVRGRRVAPHTRLLVVPASSRVYEDAARRGWIADLVAAGAVIGPPGCGPCMGNHLGVLGPGEVCVSSANRNFRGRMGEREAAIYLASPAVVAASALAGRIATPDTEAVLG